MRTLLLIFLQKKGKKLYYYEKDSKLEIDFFIRYQKTATAVEVKSAEKATSKFMTSIIQNHGVRHGIKLSEKMYREMIRWKVCRFIWQCFCRAESRRSGLLRH